MKLYEITDELALLHDQLEESGGELTESLETRLDALGGELQAKGENIGKFIINVLASAEAFKNEIQRFNKEIQRLEQKQKASEALADRLKAYMKKCMEEAGIKKISTPLFDISIQKNGGKPAVTILDEKLVPARFLTVVTETKVNKDGILAAKEGGEDVSAFAKIERGTHLRIF